jgi:hypothetical protein
MRCCWGSGLALRIRNRVIDCGHHHRGRWRRWPRYSELVDDTPPSRGRSRALAGCPLAGTRSPIDADARFVETRTGFWNHDHCLICELGIGRDEPWGYRESSFADGPNSVGLWLCEPCFGRYRAVETSAFSSVILLAADAARCPATAGAGPLRGAGVLSPAVQVGGGTGRGTGPRARCSPSAVQR